SSTISPISSPIWSSSLDRHQVVLPLHLPDALLQAAHPALKPAHGRIEAHVVLGGGVSKRPELLPQRLDGGAGLLGDLNLLPAADLLHLAPVVRPHGVERNPEDHSAEKDGDGDDYDKRPDCWLGHFESPIV